MPQLSQSARVFVCLLAVIFCCGCQNAFTRRVAHSVGYRPSTSNRENPADETSDPWIHEMGKVTREEHGVEEVNDPLKLRNIFMSERARDIERNLGVGE